MAKARMYGMKGSTLKTSQTMDHYWKRKIKQQWDRERAERNPVADKIAREKEAKP